MGEDFKTKAQFDRKKYYKYKNDYKKYYIDYIQKQYFEFKFEAKIRELFGRKILSIYTVQYIHTYI